jgi:hypothetical protein
MRELEHIAQKGAVSLRVRAVDDRMRTNDHSNFPSFVGVMT